MDVNLELIRRIISSDDLCDKANSLDCKNSYREQIKKYVIKLIDEDVNLNIAYVNRYLRKFVVNQNISKEDKFFDEVLLKLYRLNIKNKDFLDILDSFDFYQIKDLLNNRYNQIICDNISVSSNEVFKMFNFYYSVCPNFVFSSSYIDFFTFHFLSNDVSLNYELITYFYKQFALGFASSRGVNVYFEVMNNTLANDPYYDLKRKIVLYTPNIGDKIDYNVLADIFFQIKYNYLRNCVASSSIYTFEQLRFVKELCLISILGNDFFFEHYGDISFSFELRKQSYETVRSYFSRLKINIDVESFKGFGLSIVNDVDDFSDKVLSIDILFDQTMNHENPNLLKGLLRSYPILGCDYKNYKKKTLLCLLLDIYRNRKLLSNLNKDLNWYRKKLDNDDTIVSKIERLNNKISTCSSYINVMNLVINNGDMTSYDVIRSISNLITYSTKDNVVKNDIYSILAVVVPRKIRVLCNDRNEAYKSEFKKRVVKCYLDSLALIKQNDDIEYFMKIYSSLEICIKAFD